MDGPAVSRIARDSTELISKGLDIHTNVLVGKIFYSAVTSTL